MLRYDLVKQGDKYGQEKEMVKILRMYPDLYCGVACKRWKIEGVLDL